MRYLRFADPEPDCSGYATTNPDISGIGVRVSFYLQTFLLVLLVDRSWQDAPIALWTVIATSFGLTIATIVQHQSAAQLTLFQALQVSNLVWLANFGTFVALASYSRQKAANHDELVRGEYNVKFGAVIQALFSMSLTIYMWSTVSTFGSLPECSHLINYMVFAIKAPAVGAGKIVGLTASSLLTAAYLLITLHELRSYRTRRKEHATRAVSLPILHAPPPSSSSIRTIKPGDQPLSGLHPSATTTTSRYPASSHSLPQYSEASTSNVRHARRRPRRRRWSYEVDPMLIGIMICEILVFTYFIVSSELMLVSNGVSGSESSRQIGFGQILALIVVLPSALSLVGALRRHGFRRLSKRKRMKQRHNQPMNVNVFTDDTVA
ncbi:hypothetical protein C8J57DRAFT_35968 [Mycena rebaudengoi]|nr:hypothetical protein C8J57DRAFT_35968 [Mycena rebaudengoi]